MTSRTTPAPTFAPATIIAAILVAALGVAHLRVIAGSTWRDTTYHTVVAPPRLAAARAIASGSLPAWWEGTGLGVPLVGEPSHGALAPAIWLARSPQALDWLLVAHLVWAALGVALWARRASGTTSDWAALITGVLVGASGLVVATALRGALPAVAHLPWVGLAASRLATTGGRRAPWAAALAAALGMVGLGGQLALLVDAVLLAVVVGATRASSRWLALAIATGLAIACAQWIPALLVAGSLAGSTTAGLPLARLVELIAPIAPTDAIAAGPALPSLFVGAPLFALALVGPSSRRRGGLALVLLGLALVVGRGGWPGLLGAPELHLAALVIVLAPATAAGLDALAAGERRAILALAVGATCSGVALAAVVARGAGESALVDGGLGVLALAGAVTVAVLARDRTGLAARVALAGLVVGPSVGALPLVAPTVPRTIVSEPSPWAELARASAATAPRRLYRPAFLVGQGKTIETPPFEDQIATLAGALPDRFEITGARSEDPARARADDRVWTAAAFEGGALLDRYGIGLAIVPSTIVVPRQLPALGSRGTWSLVKLPVAPLATVVRGASFAIDPDEGLALLFPRGGGTGLPHGTVVLAERGDTHVDTTEPTPCTIDAWEPGDLELACRAPTAGYAVVSSSAAPGWEVTVDGAAATPRVADVIRRAVAVAPGEHVIRWRYRAPGLALGFAIAGLGLVGIALLLARRRLSRP